MVLIKALKSSLVLFHSFLDLTSDIMGRVAGLDGVDVACSSDIIFNSQQRVSVKKVNVSFLELLHLFLLLLAGIGWLWVKFMIIFKEHRLDVFAELDIVSTLVLKVSMYKLDLFGPHAVEVFHLSEQLLGYVGLEEGVYELPEVVVVLHFPGRDHPVVVGFPDVVVLVVYEVEAPATVLALRSRG